MADKVTDIKEAKKSNNIEVQSAFLHQAIMIDGQTEKTITKARLRTLKSIEWTPNGFLVITANKVHILPGAAVADSIV